jgi:hypothetical protein
MYLINLNYSILFDTAETWIPGSDKEEEDTSSGSIGTSLAAVAVALAAAFSF